MGERTAYQGAMLISKYIPVRLVEENMGSPTEERWRIPVLRLVRGLVLASREVLEKNKRDKKQTTLDPLISSSSTNTTQSSMRDKMVSQRLKKKKKKKTKS